MYSGLVGGQPFASVERKSEVQCKHCTLNAKQVLFVHMLYNAYSSSKQACQY